MKFGLPISFALHALCVSGGVMLWQGQAKTVEVVKIIPLEIITVSERTNIKPTRRTIEDIVEPETVEPVEPPATEPDELATKPIETPAETSTEMTAVKPDAKLGPKLETTEEPPKEPAFNLDAFSNMVDKSRTENPDANTQIVLTGEAEQARINQNGTNDRDEMTVSPTDYIRAKMEPCWHIDKGAKDYQGLRVEVALDLNENGEISTLNIRNGAQIIASGSHAWRAARENVIAALNECAPYEGLRAQKYETWQNMKLNFQPGDT